ncbi:MAG TPA: GreA/GreB family elongation factor [Phycisphaerae bacterium]|nr:GreA/GreB family elongation factor [Phycisphaerae bacterium]
MVLMGHETLRTLANAKRWSELESEWLTRIAQPASAPDELLKIIDTAVEAGQGKLAETMGWAWLSSMKENHSAREALQLGRGLLLRLPDGEQLRSEILALYKETHKQHPDLETWVEKSGLQQGKSVRRALRYLDVGLRLSPGSYLMHRTEDEAAQIVETDFDADEIVIKGTRGKRTVPLGEIVNDYDPADENDFQVLQQLNPGRIAELVQSEPVTLAIGICRCHKNQIDRDQLKLILVPKYVQATKWTDWWNRLKSGLKKTPNLRVEGRSPIFLIYDPVGQTPEQETWNALQVATEPRQWLELLETYLRDTKAQRSETQPDFLNRVQTALVGHIERFRRHKNNSKAFATALIIERLATDGLSIVTNAHGTAVEMLRSSENPVSDIADIPDARLWGLAASAVEEAFPEKWPAYFAEMVLFAPAGQCDTLAKRVEKAGQGELLKSIVDRALADPGRYTDAVMWIWKGPSVETPLPVPPALELFTLVLSLVGPARSSEGKAAGQSVNEMRAKVRSGIGAKNYARFRECLKPMDLSMAQAFRRQIERAEGVGPSVQSELLGILSEAFPKLYFKVEVPIWDDESSLYFSREGLRQKESELDDIINVKMRENAKAIGEAASRGDLSENSEYKYALEERDLLRARVANINNDLAKAKIIDPESIPLDHVSIGQKVDLKAPDGKELSLTILGVGDGDMNRHIYSYQTPIARQLLGKKPGQRVRVSLDGKTEAELQIVDIQKALD